MEILCNIIIHLIYLTNDYFNFRILIFQISRGLLNRLLCKSLNLHNMQKKKPDIRNANINEYKRFTEAQ